MVLISMHVFSEVNPIIVNSADSQVSIIKTAAQKLNFMHDDTEVGPIIVNGTCSLISVARITALKPNHMTSLQK